MAQASLLGGRRTSVDDVFDQLHDEILSLRLRPGDKISEAEVAARFGVSRQPVRDAFSRLANLDLLLIRPQRATEVRRFSMREIEKARFVRLAIEVEVLRRAAARCDATGGAGLDAALARQAVAVEARDAAAFGPLDTAFHRLLCQIAGVDFAAEVIRSEKAKIDRLCLLSLTEAERMPELLEDHRAIASAVIAGDAEGAAAAGALHLTRLDETIRRVAQSNAEYFEAS